jgi:hypothetical protein
VNFPGLLEGTGGRRSFLKVLHKDFRLCRNQHRYRNSLFR